MKKSDWSKIIKLLITVLAAIGSFLGGQAAAQSGLINVFGKEVVNG